MLKRRTLGVAISAAAAASIIGFGASALASSHAPRNANRAQAALTGGQAPPAPAHPKAHTHTLSIATSAFAPDHIGTTTEDHFNRWDPATLSETDGRCFNAALTPPGNATLKSVRVYYTAGTTTGMYFEVNRQNLINHTSKKLVVFTTKKVTTPAYTSTSKPIKSFGRVDYSKYAYGVGVCPGPDTSTGTTFSGVTLTYTTR